MTLPAIVQDIADVIGRDAALYLVGHHLRWDGRGQRGKAGSLYVPHKLTANHRLVLLLGLKTATALVAGFGGEIIHLSSCKGIVQRFRDDEIRRLAADGANDNALADWFGVTRRHVRNIRAL